MGFLTKLLKRQNMVYDLAAELAKQRVEDGSHPEFKRVEEVDGLNGRQLKRLPEWMLATTARTTIRAKRLNPLASLTSIIEQAEMAYRRIGRDDERMAAILETAKGANTMKAIRQFVRYRVEMSHPGAMDEETFDKAFDAAVRRIGGL